MDGEPPGMMCPSTPVANATVFLGMVTPRQRIAYVTPEVAVDAHLLETLDGGAGSLESRYRFAGPCVEQGCGFWGGTRCELGARLTDSYAELDADDPELPRCAIRKDCRWFAEQRARACAACPHVITDVRPVATVDKGQSAP